jgi:thioredoxin 2
MTTASKPRRVVARCPFCHTLNTVDLTRLAEGPICAECRRPLLLDRPTTVTDEDFDRIIRAAEVPVLVDCHADWCGPCRMMAPVLDDFAHARAGEVLVAKLDTDANPRTAERLGIRSIPTLIAFRDGREIGREIGLVRREALDALVQDRAPGA